MLKWPPEKGTRGHMLGDPRGSDPEPTEGSTLTSSTPGGVLLPLPLLVLGTGKHHNQPTHHPSQHEGYSPPHVIMD